MDEGLAKRRLFVVLTLIVMVLLFVGGWFWSQRNNGKTPVKFVVVPGDAQITANGKSVKGKTAFKPGKYTFEARREGFKSLKLDVEITDAQRTVVLPLLASSNEAKKWAKDHMQQYYDAEAIEGSRVEESGQKFVQKNPLTKNLPYHTSYYSIGYAPSARKGEIYISITSNSPMGRQVAVQKIRSWGYEPSDYEIVFTGFDNAFERAYNGVEGE